MIDFAFIDSGTGGIPYLTHLISKVPSLNCVYIGDTKNFPYGKKTHEQIVNCTLELAKKIIEKFNPKVIVVACNTISVNTLDVLREVFPTVEFIGTVPAIKLAATVSKTKRIGLLATESTCTNPYNIDLKNHFATDCTLFLRSDQDLISFIEKHSFTAKENEIINACMPSINYFKENNCDCIILGCTHFLNISSEIKKACGNSIEVVDSKEGVVNRCLYMIEKLGIKENKKNNPFAHTLYITGFNEQKDKEEYDVICKKYNLTWGGVL